MQPIATGLVRKPKPPQGDYAECPAKEFPLEAENHAPSQDLGKVLPTFEKSFFGPIRKHPYIAFAALIFTSSLTFYYSKLFAQQSRDDRGYITFLQLYAEMQKENGPRWEWSKDVHRKLLKVSIQNVLERSENQPFKNRSNVAEPEYLTALNQAMVALSQPIADGDDRAAKKWTKVGTAALEKAYISLGHQGLSTRYFDYNLTPEQAKSAENTFLEYVNLFREKVDLFSQDPTFTNAEEACMASRFVATAALWATPEITAKKSNRELLLNLADEVRKLRDLTRNLSDEYKKTNFVIVNWEDKTLPWAKLKNYAISQTRRAQLIEALAKRDLKKASETLEVALDNKD